MLAQRLEIVFQANHHLRQRIQPLGIHEFDGCVKVLPNGEFSGFEIELLEAASKEEGFKFELVQYDTFAKLLGV